MASVINQVAREWNLTRQDNLLFGRINDIFVNLTFVKHIRENVNEKKPDYTKPVSFAAFEWMFQPKYDHVSVDVYVNRKKEIDIAEVSGFLDAHYENFRTSLPIFVNGHFEITLSQRDYINVKAWYVNDFLTILTDYLNETGYSSGCQECGGSDNLSQVYNAGIAKEVCRNCILKQAKL